MEMKLQHSESEIIDGLIEVVTQLQVPHDPLLNAIETQPFSGRENFKTCIKEALHQSLEESLDWLDEIIGTQHQLNAFKLMNQQGARVLLEELEYCVDLPHVDTEALKLALLDLLKKNYTLSFLAACKSYLEEGHPPLTPDKTLSDAIRASEIAWEKTQTRERLIVALALSCVSFAVWMALLKLLNE